MERGGANGSRQRSAGGWKDIYRLDIAIELGPSSSQTDRSTCQMFGSSKVHWFKISQFLFSQNQPGREKCENLQHAKISRYTVSLPVYNYLAII